MDTESPSMRQKSFWAARYRALLRSWRVTGLSILAGASIAGTGCGSRSGEEPIGRTLPWMVSSVHGARQVKLVGQVDYCAGAVEPKVETVHSRYSGRDIYLSLVLTQARSAFLTDPCRGSVRAVYRTVKLRRDLKSSVLYDSGVDPAVKRWPAG